MRVTKYPQSCLVIEDHGQKLLIDPGTLVSQAYQADEFSGINSILLTHEHADHVDDRYIKKLILDNKAIEIVGNQSTANLFPGLVTRIVSDGESFDLVGFKLVAHELPHCKMVDGSPGPQNTGYVINSVFFHPGDGIEVENLAVDSAAVPIAGPDISPRDIFGFVKQLGCKTVVPVHYDYFPNDPNFVANFLKNVDANLKVVVLNNGEVADI